MWRYQLGYLLHPTIPTDKEGLQIADVACGTGIWLVELARILPASTKLDGYDISSEQYPAKEWLPKNVTLGTLNALDTVPDALRGKYDIVHISLFVMLVRNEDPGPILNNLMLMLSTFPFTTPNGSGPNSSKKLIIQSLQSPADTCNGTRAIRPVCILNPLIQPSLTRTMTNYMG